MFHRNKIMKEKLKVVAERHKPRVGRVLGVAFLKKTYAPIPPYDSAHYAHADLSRITTE